MLPRHAAPAVLSEERVLYPRNKLTPGAKPCVVGGKAITEQQAIELRLLVFGTASCPPRAEWVRSPIVMRAPGQPLGYGLAAPRNGARSLLAGLQAYIIKWLLFDSRPLTKDNKSMEPPETYLRPLEERQDEALWRALSEVIWRCAGGFNPPQATEPKAVVALPTDNIYVQHSSYYYQDSITEKFKTEDGCGALLLLFAAVLSRGCEKFPKDKNLQKEWVRRIGKQNHIPKTWEKFCSKHFNPDSFLPTQHEKGRHLKPDACHYFASKQSVETHLGSQTHNNILNLQATFNKDLTKFMFSCNIPGVKKDLDGKLTYLVSSQPEGSLNVVTLLLTGRATPYLHNGVVYIGDEDHYAMPQFGVLSRSSVGLLIWYGNEDNAKNTANQQYPGSRLKTPALPIWVTSCSGHYGVLFNTNRELLRNYHAERRFDIHYYTCGGCHVLLNVDTRTQDDTAGQIRSDDITATPLEKLIHTKWQDAKMTWTGPGPNISDPPN